MNSNAKNTLWALFYLLSVVSCVPPGHQAAVHPYATQAPPSSIKQVVQKPRHILICLDGTSNDVTSRTNVRKLYEIAASLKTPNVLCYYDQGVGTTELGKTRWSPQKFLGDVGGYGFENNIWEAMTFLSTNFEDGDKVHIFGFSRGAYSAGVLATVIGTAGVPLTKIREGESNEALFKRAKKKCRKRYKIIRSLTEKASKDADHAERREKGESIFDFAKRWRADFHKRYKKTALMEGADSTRIDTETLGLWDPVSSLLSSWKMTTAIAWSHGPEGEISRQKGNPTSPYFFGSHIKNCFVALALDERRQAFAPDLPDSRFGKPDRYEMVWFSGDHSDLGGGHADKDLAGVSLNWMLSKVAVPILGKRNRNLRVHEDPLGDRHDWFYSSTWRRFSYRTRSEVLSSDVVINVGKGDGPFHQMRPVRSEGWKMKLHSSVIKRMKSGKDWYAKIHPHDDEPKRGYLEGSYDVGQYIPRPFRYENFPYERRRFGAIGHLKYNGPRYYDSEEIWETRETRDLTVADLVSRYEIVK